MGAWLITATYLHVVHLLSLRVTHPSINRTRRTGTDSMGAIALTAKKLWGAMPQSRHHRNFVMSPLCTSKRYSKNYECVIMKVRYVH